MNETTTSLFDTAVNAMRALQSINDELTAQGAESTLQPVQRTAIRKTMTERSSEALKAYADAAGLDPVTAVIQVQTAI